MPHENIARRNAKRLLASAGNHCYRAAESLYQLSLVFLEEENEMGLRFAEVGQGLITIIEYLQGLWEEAWGPPPENWLNYH